MRLFVTTFLLAGFMALLSSCGDDGETSGGPKIELTFLAEGTEYHYYALNFFGDDSIKCVIGEQIGRDTFLVRNYSDLITVFPTQYWTVKDGNFYTSYRLRDPEAYQIECKFGKPKGTSWKVRKGSATYTYTIDEVDVSITTGQSEITDAVKVKIQTGSSTYYQYFSPTIGLIGTGNFEDESASMRLVRYVVGNPASTNKVTPPITYGDFPFLEVGNYWTYSESSLLGEDELTVTVESKLSSKNIYKVHLSYASGGEGDSYWFEDNGYLMTYDEGEDITQADPLYVIPSKAKLEEGWGSLTESGRFYIYEITSLDEAVDTFYGELPAMGIYVTDGLFVSQTNYWHLNKGNVLVTGAGWREIIGTNVRQSQRQFIPMLAPL